MIDRVSGAVRPDGKPAGYQLWRDLLFLHWEVPASLLQSLIPKPLVVDEFEGKAFIGLVPFVMKNVRPRWWTLGAGFNFLETNMRTYVVHQGMPGVYFFSLDANSIIAVLAAKLGWSLPYYVARQSIRRHTDRVAYSNVRIGSKSICSSGILARRASRSIETPFTRTFPTGTLSSLCSSTWGDAFRSSLPHSLSSSACYGAVNATDDARSCWPSKNRSPPRLCALRCGRRCRSIPDDRSPIGALRTKLVLPDVEGRAKHVRL